jgi:hypothetical protein
MWSKNYEKIYPESAKTILFINQRRHLGRDIPMVDIKFDSRDTLIADKKIVC